MLSPSTSLQYLHLSEQSTSASEPDAEALAAASHTAEALGCGALKAVKCDSCGSEEACRRAVGICGLWTLQFAR